MQSVPLSVPYPVFWWHILTMTNNHPQFSRTCASRLQKQGVRKGNKGGLHWTKVEPQKVGQNYLGEVLGYPLMEHGPEGFCFNGGHHCKKTSGPTKRGSSLIVWFHAQEDRVHIWKARLALLSNRTCNNTPCPISG